MEPVRRGQQPSYPPQTMQHGSDQTKKVGKQAVDSTVENLANNAASKKTHEYAFLDLETNPQAKTINTIRSAIIA